MLLSDWLPNENVLATHTSSLTGAPPAVSWIDEYAAGCGLAARVLIRRRS